MRLWSSSGCAGLALLGLLLPVCAVEHKNLQLDLYLDLIRYNSHEKIGILPYILENVSGKYLEIGTGGDPIREMLSKIPSTAEVTVIASDIEQAVLDAIPRRHPELEKYITAQTGLRLSLQQLNAIDMHIFDDAELDGINASSLVHEIVSYAGGLSALDTFFSEALRVLKPGGVLVYRDPESLPDFSKQVVISLKNKVVRLFAHIFFCKFLDTRGSNLARSGRRFRLYDPSDIRFCVYTKNESLPITVSYEEYLKIPSYDIDFSRRSILYLPNGLYREFARHYITYLHQCNPLVFARFVPDVISGLYVPYYLAHSTSKVLADFLVTEGWELLDGKITRIHKSAIDTAIAKNLSVLEFGIPFRMPSRTHERNLRELLKHHGFEPSRHIIALNNGDCLLDYRVFGLLYDELCSNVFNRFDSVVDDTAMRHVQWLKREGEESYCYLSVDALVSRVLENSIAQHSDGVTCDSAVLCPIDSEHIKFIERLCYTEVLKEAFDLHDDMGYPLEIKDGKQIVHFRKMRLGDARAICAEIVNQSPLEYPNLSELIDKIDSFLKCNG